MKKLLFCILSVLVHSLNALPVFALHEHELKPGCNHELYVQEVGAVLGKMQVPGLLHAYHLKCFKGTRAGRYAVLWIFESQQAIEDNFGTLDKPRWPADWLFYENEILAKYLICHPDKIRFADYCPIHSFDYSHQEDPHGMQAL